jgi:hypothetical protein
VIVYFCRFTSGLVKPFAGFYSALFNNSEGRTLCFLLITGNQFRKTLAEAGYDT